ncbi:ATP-binding protein [soil metagenome]
MKNAMLGSLIPRHAMHQVQVSLREARVVIVNGPRQAGKTTLVRDQLEPRGAGSFVTLDDETELAACLADPRTFLDRPRPVIVDEFQYAGDRLLRAVKALVDESPVPGQFLLTGSTRFMTLRTISESLAGRVHIVDLWPYTQGEAQRLGSDADSFLPRALQGQSLRDGIRPDAVPRRRDYLELLCCGGYPEAVTLESEARRRFFRNYVRTVTQRDVPQISRVRHIGELSRILQLLAATTAQETKDTALAERLRIDRRTLRANYLPLLHTVYLAFELPAWSRNLVSRVSSHPKSYLVDTGLATHLLGTTPEKLAEPTATGTGALLETFAVNELVRQAARFGDDLGVALFHYRAHTGGEIDVIAETDDGRIVGIEIKAAASVDGGDFAHLAAVRDRIDRLRDCEFVRGVVLYTGNQSHSFGDRLEALPLAALWLPLST